MKPVYTFFLLSAFALAILSCQPDEVAAVYDPSRYTLIYDGLPTPTLAQDNPLTLEGVKLGRMLFYEKRLSKDNSLSCAGCHLQVDGFSDKNRFSKGVGGKTGGRQAMPVFNMAWHYNGFFWDGRAPLLRDQSLRPIQDPLEMNETLTNVLAKLQADKTYRDQFVKAFEDGLINEKNMSLAMEQFMMTIVSNKSKFDMVKAGKAQFTNSEERGRKLFFTEYDPAGNVKGAECFHCHGGPNFTNDEYMNNGLDTDAGQKDEGRYKVTLDPSDKARFLTPSLRNIALTAPYMHDGRFSTLDEVLKHYNTDAKHSATVDFLMQYNLQPGGLGLTVQDLADLKAFMLTLTDESLTTNKDYSDPF